MTKKGKAKRDCNSCRNRSKWNGFVPIFSCRELCLKKMTTENMFPMWEADRDCQNCDKPRMEVEKC